jgi:hypothetical protein
MKMEMTRMRPDEEDERAGEDWKGCLPGEKTRET